jgi:hypothetical protein
LVVHGKDEAEESMLFKWLCDSSRKAAFLKAIKSILTTKGKELMLDTPRPIYEASLKEKETSISDIWGGVILLDHCVELLAMVIFGPFLLISAKCISWPRKSQRS